MNANSYIRMMPHTAAANVGIFFGMKGRVIPTSSACTSGSQAIGYAFEAIQHGYQTRMLAGGAEELCPTQAKAFDTLYATSRRNDKPELTPRPYDAERDGLVVGEGAGFLVLEELAAARARGATIHAGNPRLLHQQRRHPRDAPRRKDHARGHGECAAQRAHHGGSGWLRERPWYGDHAR